VLHVPERTANSRFRYGLTYKGKVWTGALAFCVVAWALAIWGIVSLLS
jgi:hypothetical protein